MKNLWFNKLMFNLKLKFVNITALIFTVKYEMLVLWNARKESSPPYKIT